MAYEHERDEWRYDLRRTTEAQRYIAQHAQRWAQGLVGDELDACEGCHTYLNEEDADD